LQQLCNSTKKKILYKESDFFKSIDYLLCLENKIPISDFNNIKLAYNIINNYFSREKYDGYVEFSVYHGDFTPWNMFEEKGKLFVFDWEYYSLTYPPFLDIFHYIIQIALLEKKLDIQSVFRYYDEQKKILSAFFNDIDFLLLCYLMNIISFYFKLNDGDLSLNDRCYVKWIKLLDGILKRL
jgi:thiamine kinase-like enzyme